jgi:hypothetical protein
MSRKTDITIINVAIVKFIKGSSEMLRFTGAFSTVEYSTVECVKMDTYEVFRYQAAYRFEKKFNYK